MGKSAGYNAGFQDALAMARHEVRLATLEATQRGDKATELALYELLKAMHAITPPQEGIF